MGNTATKARDAHTEAKSRPKTSRKIQQQKIKNAKRTDLLSLSNSKLKHLPEELLQLSTLRILDLTGNKLTTIPSTINVLTTLKTLKLSLNNLETLPDLSALEALTTLVLDSNKVETLVHALPPHLLKLSLKNNRLGMIPDNVLKLMELQELDLSDNHVEVLPSDLGKMQELQELHVDGNTLTELPAALAKCGKLKVLSARRNMLIGRSAGATVQTIAAEVLGEGSSIQVMNLEGNPMTKEDLQGMDGFNAFLTRRMKLKNKEIHGGLKADLSLCGLN